VDAVKVVRILRRNTDDDHRAGRRRERDRCLERVVLARDLKGDIHTCPPVASSN